MGETKKKMLVGSREKNGRGKTATHRTWRETNRERASKRWKDSWQSTSQELIQRNWNMSWMEL